MFIIRTSFLSRFGNRSYSVFFEGGNSNSRLLRPFPALSLSTSNVRCSRGTTFVAVEKSAPRVNYYRGAERRRIERRLCSCGKISSVVCQSSTQYLHTIALQIWKKTLTNRRGSITIEFAEFTGIQCLLVAGEWWNGRHNGLKIHRP